jgi:hypothetical protein
MALKRRTVVSMLPTNPLKTVMGLIEILVCTAFAIKQRSVAGKTVPDEVQHNEVAAVPPNAMDQWLAFLHIR